MSALASSSALWASCSAARTVARLARPTGLDLVRPQAVHQLVHQDVGEERLEGDLLRSAGASATLLMGTSTLANFASCTFFSIVRLVPISLRDALVVGQVERRGLDAPVGVTRAEDRVHHPDGRHRPDLRVPQLGIDGQVVLDVLQLARELRQLRGLGVVAQGDERLERRLGVEPAVLVDLVRADGRLDAGVQLHPGHVAGVVVVGQERRRPRLQERLQRRLGWSAARHRRSSAAAAASSAWYSRL